MQSEKYIRNFFLNILKLSILPQNFTANQFRQAEINKIIVIKRHQMGDMLCCLPMMKALRSKFPDAHIILVTKSSTNYKRIFDTTNPYCNEVLEYESGFENFINLVKHLRDTGYDLAVIPSTVVFSATNHLIAYYSQAKFRVGASSINTLDNKAEFLLNIKKDFLWNSQKIHQVERNLDIIRQAGIDSSDKSIDVPVSENHLKFAEEFLTKSFSHLNVKPSKIIGFHPGAAKPGNTWPPENFVKLAQLLYKKFNCSIFISEGPSDKKYAATIVSGLIENKIPYTVHAGLLMNNAAIVSMLDLFIANDTGMMHLASAFKTPLIALFGETRAWEWGPFGENKYSIQSPSENINGITVEQVCELATKILI